MLFSKSKRELPTPDNALPGRSERPFRVPATHAVLGTPIEGPYPANLEVAYFGTGCFWGAEEIFWQVPGVWSTAVGYQGGDNARTRRTKRSAAGAPATPRPCRSSTTRRRSPTRRCSRRSGSSTTRPRASGRATTSARSTARRSTPPPRTRRWRRRRSREVYAPLLRAAGYGDITTEIVPAGPFYFAEDYHQQYLHKVPNGYRCHSASGITFPGQD